MLSNPVLPRASPKTAMINDVPGSSAERSVVSGGGGGGSLVCPSHIKKTIAQPNPRVVIMQRQRCLKHTAAATGEPLSFALPDDDKKKKKKRAQRRRLPLITSAVAERRRPISTLYV